MEDSAGTDLGHCDGLVELVLFVGPGPMEVGTSSDSDFVGNLDYPSSDFDFGLCCHTDLLDYCNDFGLKDMVEWGEREMPFVVAGHNCSYWAYCSFDQLLMTPLLMAT